MKIFPLFDLDLNIFRTFYLFYFLCVWYMRVPFIDIIKCFSREVENKLKKYNT